MTNNPWFCGSTLLGQCVCECAPCHTSVCQCVSMLVLCMCVCVWGGHQGWWGHVHKPQVHISILCLSVRLCSVSSCHPGVQSHSLHVGPILLLGFGRRGPQEDHGGLLGHGAGLVVEVGTPASSLGAVVPVAALIRAAVAAEAVDRRAALTSRFQAQGTRVGDRHQTLTLDLTLAGPSSSSPYASPASRDGSAAVTVRGDGLGLDVDVGVCVDCQRGALRYVTHRPGEAEPRQQRGEQT